MILAPETELFAASAAATPLISPWSHLSSGLADRFASARDDVASLDPDEETLVAGLPHLDGTPLEEEPCVPALRTLLESLEGMKGDAAATLAAAQAQRADEEATGSLAAALVNRPDGVSADTLRAFVETTVEHSAANISSMLADVRAGRRTEIEQFNGWIARRADARGVACPHTRAGAEWIRGSAPPAAEK